MLMHFENADTQARADGLDFNDEINWVTRVTETLLTVYGLGANGGSREKLEAAKGLAALSWYDNFGEICYIGRCVLIEDLTQGFEESHQHINAELWEVIQEAREVAARSPEAAGDLGL
jgi:hypothetical protein